MQRCRELRQSEAGVAIVWFVLLVGIILMLGSFAIDVSNFFRHKRQLQTQADAAALAGGSQMQPGDCAPPSVLTEADKFVGTSVALWNKPSDPATLGRTSRVYVQEDDPCSIEAQVTETEAPFYFPLTAALNPDIRAFAKVELKQIQGMGGALPIAIQEDREIQRVRMVLVDEGKPGTDPTRELQSVVMAQATDGITTSTPWTGTFAPHNLTQARIGVRIHVEYGSDTACSSADVDCFDADASENGLLHIRGFEQVPDVTTNAPPALEDVQIDTGACAAPHNGYVSDGACSVNVSARIDWVDAVTDAGTPNEKTINSRAQVAAQLGTAGFELTYSSATGRWAGAVTVPPTAGPLPLRLAWTQQVGRVKPASEGPQCDDGKGKAPAPCYGVWIANHAAGLVRSIADEFTAAEPPVHRVFSLRKERSGPVIAAEVREGSSAGAIANSTARCGGAVTSCSRSWFVKVRLPLALEAGAKRTITIAAPGSNDGHLDCDPPGGGSDFRRQIAGGCKSVYEINEGEACPEPKDLPASPQPWSCVVSAPGDKSGPFSDGMNDRIYGTDVKPTPALCAARANVYPSYLPTDPRIVPVMVVRPPSLDATGNAIWPVKDFAFFYVTGWFDNGKPACAIADSNNDPAGKGELVGHFIKYAAPNDGDVFGTDPCEEDALGGCVPILVK